MGNNVFKVAVADTDGNPIQPPETAMLQGFDDHAGKSEGDPFIKFAVSVFLENSPCKYRFKVCAQEGYKTLYYIVRLQTPNFVGCSLHLHIWKVNPK